MNRQSEIIAVGPDRVEIRRRRGLRGMSLSVQPDGNIRVRCNLRRGYLDIEQFVLASADFIEKRREQVREVEAQFPRRSFISGETFLWMGVPVVLDVVWSWDQRIKVKRTETGFEMIAPVVCTPEERLKALSKFYRREAKAWLAARVEFWSRIMGFGPESVTVRGQRTLWGSCTAAGAVSLNWKLMSCTPEAIDYVVVHELCHLKEQNHSARFWALVAGFMADYKTHRRWLKDHQQAIARQFLVRAS